MVVPIAAVAGTAIVQFGGDVRFSGSSTLEMEIGGTIPGSGHDQLRIAGELVIEGAALEVAFAGGYVPMIGDRFDLFDASAISGTFASQALPALPPGRYWNRSQLYVDGQLAIGMIPDRYNEWAALFGVGSPGEDDDCDGVANLIEYLLATHPDSNAGTDGVAGTPVVSLAGGKIALTFVRPELVGADAVYRVQVAPHPSDVAPLVWTTIASKISGHQWQTYEAMVFEGAASGGLVEVTVQASSMPAGGRQQFIRLVGELIP